MSRPILERQRLYNHLTYIYRELIKLFRFGALGIVLNILAFLTYYIAVVYFGANPFFSVLLITPLYVIVSFFAQQKFVFKTKTYTWAGGIRFSMFYFTFYFLNLIGIHVLVNILKADPVLSQALLVLLIGTVSFLSFRRIFLD